MSYRFALAPRGAARTFFGWTAITAPAAALIGFGWFVHLNVTPTPPDVIPSPVAPAVNGFDTLLLADSQKVRREEIDIAESTKPVAEKHVYTPAEKAELVAANAQALATLRLALTQDYANRPVRSTDQLLPELAKFRGLARLLTLDAQVREANGDYAGAVQSDLDAVALGVTIPHGGPVIHGLVGMACVSIGDHPLWQRVDHLDAAQAAAAAGRLQSLDDRSVSYTDTLREEKWTVEASMVKELTGRSTFRAWRDVLDELYPDGTGYQMGYGEYAAGYASLLVHSKQDIVNRYTAYMNDGITQSTLPYRPNRPERVAPSDPINVMFCGVFTNAEFKARSTRMETGLLTSALALRSYRLSHGAYPATLSDLVDAGILSHVPADPFASADGVAFRYRRLADDKFQLYSVGADGVDDGGKAVDLTHGNDLNRHWINADDKGDWVVGVDTPPISSLVWGRGGLVITQCGRHRSGQGR